MGASAGRGRGSEPPLKRGVAVKGGAATSPVRRGCCQMGVAASPPRARVASISSLLRCFYYSKYSPTSDASNDTAACPFESGSWTGPGKKGMGV